MSVKAKKYGAKKLKRDGYFVVENFIDKDLASLMCQYIRDKAECARLLYDFYPDKYDAAILGNPVGDKQVEGAYALPNDLFFDTFAHVSLEKIEKMLNLELVPTYNYSRLYYKGCVLRPHTDRPSCEVSVSICLGNQSGDSWPLHFNDKPIDLDPGDAVFYMGEKVPHSRPALDCDWHAQLFMHYNDVNGPYKMSNAYDGHGERFLSKIGSIKGYPTRRGDFDKE